MLAALLSLCAIAAHEEPAEAHFRHDPAKRELEALRLGGTELYDPDIAFLGDVLWVTWLKHVPGRGDQLWIGSRVADEWRSQERVPQVGRSLACPTLTANDAGGLWLSVEGQGPRGTWQVLAGAFEEGVLGAFAPVSSPGGNAICHRADAAAGGAPRFVWQADRGGQFDVFTRTWGEKPGAIERVSSSPRNDWQPDVCVDKQGRSTVVWDGYGESYDVFVRQRAQDGTWGEALALADGPAFQARPRVSCDPSGRAWVAWEEGGEDWGRPYRSIANEFTNITDASGPLHRLRKLRLAVLAPNAAAAIDVPVPMPALAQPRRLDLREGVRELGAFYERPELEVDARGRPWIAYRHFLATEVGLDAPVEHHWEAGWRIYARCLGDEGWTDLVSFDAAQRDGMQRLSIAALGAGLHLAWDTGRTDRREEELERGLLLGHTSQDGAGAPRVPGDGRTLRPRASATAKAAPVTRDGMQLFYGDLHRHTDLSLCTPFFDGSLEDAYRYAADVEQLDYLAITDHTRDIDRGDVQSQLWWRATKEVTRHSLVRHFLPVLRL